MSNKDNNNRSPKTTEIGPGVYTIDLSSWTKFHDVVELFLNHPRWIFRGHRKNTWKLEPTLLRLVKGRPNYEAIVKSHLKAFRYALRGRRGPNPPLLRDDNDVFALGQHNGLATPLLDWTTSPYVALFFTFAKNVPDDSTPTRTVFCLNETRIKRVSREMSKDILGDDAIYFHRPLSDENSSLVSQSGLFTVSTGITDIETWVLRNWKDKDPKNAVLIKVQVPDNDREECVKALNRMNINYASLFPDIRGACKHANMMLEIKNY